MLIKINLVLVVVLAVSGCIGGPISKTGIATLTPIERATLGDGGLSSFYDYTDDLPSLPGILLKQEEMVPHASMPAASQSYRLLYTSTEGITGESQTIVSGTLFLPSGDPPSNGWTLLVWSHGTVGVADVCAPSWTGYVPFHVKHLQQWLDQGYAIVASDYQGLGTPGIHPYLSTRPAAFSNLDIIRAVQKAEFPISNQVVIAGQSQGAGAAIATAGYAADYAPELNLKAVVATGVPYFSPEALVALQQARPRDVVDPMLAYNFLMLTLVEHIDLEFDAANYLTSEVLPVARSVSSVCNREIRKRVADLELSHNKAFKASPSEKFEQGYRLMQYPTLNIGVPLFVGVGLSDRDTPPRMQKRFVSDSCQNGTVVSAFLYKNFDHLTTLNHSLKDSIPFVESVISGEIVARNCDSTLF